MEFNMYTVIIGGLLLSWSVSLIKCFIKKNDFKKEIEEKKIEIDKWKISSVDSLDIVGDRVADYKLQVEELKDQKHQLQMRIIGLEKDLEHKETLWKNIANQIVKRYPDSEQTFEPTLINKDQREKTFVGKLLQ